MSCPNYEVPLVLFFNSVSYGGYVYSCTMIQNYALRTRGVPSRSLSHSRVVDGASFELGRCRYSSCRARTGSPEVGTFLYRSVHTFQPFTCVLRFHSLHLAKPDSRGQHPPPSLPLRLQPLRPAKWQGKKNRVSSSTFAGALQLVNVTTIVRFSTPGPKRPSLLQNGHLYVQ